jgi:hypothetical protein
MTLTIPAWLFEIPGFQIPVLSGKFIVLSEEEAPDFFEIHKRELSPYRQKCIFLGYEHPDFPQAYDEYMKKAAEIYRRTHTIPLTD